MMTSTCSIARIAVLSLLAAVGMADRSAAQSAAPGWPAHYITMVVPFAAGSASDALGRLVSIRMSELLGQQVIVENVGGAGGMIGAARVARGQPDGYQFVLGGTDTLAQNQTLYKTPQYNAATDFTPVGLVGEQSLLLVLRNDLPASNLTELATYGRANFAKMQFASSGLGSASHLTCAQVTNWIGAEVAHVPYRGSGAALQDMVAGRLDYYCSLAASAMPHIEGKQLKAIAVLSRDRSPFLPDVATAREQGMPQMDSYFWSAAAFPKGTPKEIVDKLSAVISDTLDTPLIQERMRGLGVVPPAKERRSPAYMQTFVESEIEKWAGVIKASGVTLN